MFGLTSSCCTSSHANSSSYLMSALQIESARSFKREKRGEKKNPHETFSRPGSGLGKQSADNQRWREGGREAREGRTGEVTRREEAGGRWGSRAAAECFMSGTQRISRTDNDCTRSPPFGFPSSRSLPRSPRPSPQPRFSAVSRRRTKPRWAAPPRRARLIIRLQSRDRAGERTMHKRSRLCQKTDEQR